MKGKKTLIAMLLGLSVCLTSAAIFTACEMEGVGGSQPQISSPTQSTPVDSTPVDSTPVDTTPEDTTPVKNEISFNTLAVDGTKVYGKVNNATAEFSFIDEVTVQGNAKYVVALDKYGAQTVATKIVPLQEGDNAFYVFEMVDDEVTKSYEITIRRRPMYTVAFNTDNGMQVESQTVEEGSLATEPDAIKKFGCHFIGWEYDFSMPITQSITIDAKWDVYIDMSPFYYVLEGEACEITGVKDKTLTNIVIPDGVTSIGQSAFKDCSSLAEITLPFVGANKDRTSNTHFGYIFGANNASENDSYLPTSLKKVTITGGNIGEDAFLNCSSLTSVVIGDSVTSIGQSAFKDCSSLEEITLPFIGATKDGTSNTLFGYIFGASSESNNSSFIPNSLKKVTITGDNIGYAAFCYCRSLMSVEIGDSVTSIGENAFTYCSSLTSVEIGNSVTSISSWAFHGCSSLTEIVIPDSLESIGYAAFRGCSSLTSVVIGDSVTSIGDFAFYYCSSLTSFKIPDSVTSIGDGVFCDCSSLTSIEIPDSVTSIGEQAFLYCGSLTSVEIPDSVTSIGDEAFYNCRSLTSVYITDIEVWCNISFGSANANPLCYAKNLYLNDELVTELVIPDSVTSIGDYAFYNCSSLTSIEIPDSVTSIGDYAFYNCSSLTSIEIPDSVTSIGDSAFWYCSSLTSVYITDIEVWCNISFANSFANPFYYAKNLYLNDELVTELVIPDSVTSIGDYAFFYCSSLTSIEIPDSVTSIGDSAFWYCSSLTSISFAGTVEEWNAISKVDWNVRVPATEVVCSNGTVTL